MLVVLVATAATVVIAVGQLLTARGRGHYYNNQFYTCSRRLLLLFLVFPLFRLSPRTSTFGQDKVMTIFEVLYQFLLNSPNSLQFAFLSFYYFFYPFLIQTRGQFVKQLMIFKSLFFYICRSAS